MSQEIIFELSGAGLVKGGNRILSDISFQIKAGECLVLAGENGAGKSSLLRLFNRLDDPTQGEIRFLDNPLTRYPVMEMRRQIGMVMQGPVLFDGSVRQVMKQISTTLKMELSTEKIVESVGLSASILDRRTQDLSGGEIQLLTIGLVVQRNPRVLLLDEPASALSVTAMDRIEQILCELKAAGVTLIQVTHHVDRMVDKADRGVFLENGQVKHIGTMSEVADMFDRRS